MSELLLKEKLLPLAKVPVSFKPVLTGTIRFVDKSGKTFGLFLDKEALEEVQENLEYSSSKFWQEIKQSRKSGVVSAKSIEKRLKI